MYKTFFLASLFVLAACGSNSSSSGNGAPLFGGGHNMSAGNCTGSPMLGTYNGVTNGNPDVLTINADCTLTSSYCASKGTFQPVTAPNGSVVINITTTSNRPGCLP